MGAGSKEDFRLVECYALPFLRACAAAALQVGDRYGRQYPLLAGLLYAGQEDSKLLWLFESRTYKQIKMQACTHPLVMKVR